MPLGTVGGMKGGGVLFHSGNSVKEVWEWAH